MAVWKDLTPNERRLLHQVYDHAPETAWEPVFFRYQAAYMTEVGQRVVHLEGLGAVFYQKFNVPPRVRQAVCEKLRDGLVAHGCIFETGKAEKRGTVNYSGKGARLTDVGFYILGGPSGGAIKLNFDSDESPRGVHERRTSDVETIACLACEKPVLVASMLFSKGVCNDACHATWQAKLRAQIQGYEV